MSIDATPATQQVWFLQVETVFAACLSGVLCRQFFHKETTPPELMDPVLVPLIENGIWWQGSDADPRCRKRDKPARYLQNKT